MNLELRREGELVHLERQPARALALLLEHTGQLVTRDELRAAVWGADTHVDFERGSAYVLQQIRGALQDTASNPRFVQTIPRQGYRFIAPVEKPAASTNRRTAIAATISATAALAGTGAWLLTGPSPKRLGVSLFDNETGRADLDRWVHSLSDAVVTALTPLDPKRLAVIGNAAALRVPRNIRRLRTLMRELDAGYVLLGQLQNQPPGFRFITHLIRLPEETHLKANRLVHGDNDFGAFERRIIAEYASAIKAHVLDAL